jgi:ADP-ribose pyrophosphatase YjhB (NUDIX family)
VNKPKYTRVVDGVLCMTVMEHEALLAQAVASERERLTSLSVEPVARVFIVVNKHNKREQAVSIFGDVNEGDYLYTADQLAAARLQGELTAQDNGNAELGSLQESYGQLLAESTKRKAVNRRLLESLKNVVSLCDQLGYYGSLVEDARLTIAIAETEGKFMIPLLKAVETVLEGFTLPDDARKILEAAYYDAREIIEAAYYSTPLNQASQQRPDDNADADEVKHDE